MSDRLETARAVKEAKALLTQHGYTVAKVATPATRKPTKAEVQATRTPVKANPNHTPAPKKAKSTGDNPILFRSITRGGLKVKKLRMTNLDNQLAAYIESHPQYDADTMKKALLDNGVMLTQWKRYEVIDFDGREPLDLTSVTFA